MGKLFEGVLLGKGLKFAVVVSRFNEFITGKLLDGARDALLRHGVSEGDIDVAWVPGSFEIPLLAKSLAQTKRYDAVICLGAVIRGATPHFEYVAAEVASAHTTVGLSTHAAGWAAALRHFASRGLTATHATATLRAKRAVQIGHVVQR